MGVQAELSGVALQTLDLELLLLLEQEVVHGPVVPLVSGAMGCFRNFAGLRMEAGEGQVPPYIAHLSGLDIVPLQKRLRSLRKSATEGALIIGEFDQGQRGFGGAEHWLVGHTHRHRSIRPWGWWRLP